MLMSQQRNQAAWQTSQATNDCSASYRHVELKPPGAALESSHLDREEEDLKQNLAQPGLKFREA